MTGGWCSPSLRRRSDANNVAGTKLVLFVTGRCHWGCTYCIVGEPKESQSCTPTNVHATWSGSSRRLAPWTLGRHHRRGPVLDLERSLDAIRELKGAFGHAHHIHLYTSIPIEPCGQRLADAGDELRFHLLDLNLDH